MKKNILLAAAMLSLLTSQRLFAQQNHLYIGLEGFSLNIEEVSGLGPMLGFETLVKERMSIGGTFSATFSEKALAVQLPGNFRLRENMVHFRPGLRFFSKANMLGFGFGVHGTYIAYRYSAFEKGTGMEFPRNTDLRQNFLGFGIGAGYTGTVHERILFRIEAISDLLLNVTQFEEGTLSMGLRASIGYRF